MIRQLSACADGSAYASRQRPLVRACRHAMLRLRAQGLFQRVLFIDTWHLTSLHGAPISWDGNHRTTTFQTLVWTLLRFAFLQLRCAHS